MLVKEGSLSIQSNKQIGHFVNDGDNGRIASGACFGFLSAPPPPQEAFFLELVDDEEDDDKSLADLLRFDLFSSCLRSTLLLLLFENSEELVL